MRVVRARACGDTSRVCAMTLWMDVSTRVDLRAAVRPTGKEEDDGSGSDASIKLLTKSSSSNLLLLQAEHLAEEVRPTPPVPAATLASAVCVRTDPLNSCAPGMSGWRCRWSKSQSTRWHFMHTRTTDEPPCNCCRSAPITWSFMDLDCYAKRMH